MIFGDCIAGIGKVASINNNGDERIFSNGRDGGYYTSLQMMEFMVQNCGSQMELLEVRTW